MSNNCLFGDQSIVPMVMFHIVGGENMGWEYRHIAESVAEFESKIASLQDEGFNFKFWSPGQKENTWMSLNTKPGRVLGIGS